MMRSVLVAAIITLIAGPVSGRDYSTDQLELAGRLGAAQALTMLCPTYRINTPLIMAAFAKAGLSNADLDRESELRTRLIKQIRSVLMSSKLTINMGVTAEQANKQACKNAIEMYGTTGIVMPNLIVRK